jgi:hypothetical protein
LPSLPSCCRNENSTIHCARMAPHSLARWSLRLRKRRELFDGLRNKQAFQFEKTRAREVVGSP